MALSRHQICLLVLVGFLLIDLTIVEAGRRDKDKGREKDKDKRRSRNERSRNERSKNTQSRNERSRNERSKNKNKKVCYEIESDFCKDVLNYNVTRLPNQFGHRKLRHAERFLEEMAMVVETGCSPYLRAFLCSIYLPECPDRKKNDPLPPCRTLCEKAKADCLDVFHSFGKDWPLASCDELPSPRKGSASKRDRCINYEPPMPDYCMLHKDVGPCKTYYPFWYYNDIEKECEPFTYGGCLGNKNRFHSKESCVRTCGNGKGETTTTALVQDTSTIAPVTSKIGLIIDDNLPPDMVEPPRDATIEAGGSVTLMCAASRAVEYTWSRVDGKMPEAKIVEEGTMSGRAKLVLKDLDPEDSGMYMCTAENDGGVIEGVAEVHVQAQPPVITQFPISVSVVEGGTFVMICAAEGAPSPLVEWTRFDNTPVQQTTNGSLSTAEVRNVQMSDEGDYYCKATNKYGDLVMKAITIQVLVPVYLGEKPQSAMVIAGSNAVNLTCTAMGDPMPTITWMKLDGSKEIDQRRYEFDVIDQIGQIGRVTSTLRIYDVKASDAGTYECVAKSALGNQTATATITVQVPPSFKKAPMDKYASVGDDVTLECSAVGTPPLHIFWWKEGSGNLSLPDGNYPRYSLDNEGMDLLINHVIPDDEGRYHCGIVNAADSIVGSMALTVSSQDDLPRIIKGPDNTTVSVGERAIFNCNVTGRPFPHVGWFVDEIDVELFADPRLVREGTSLIVNDVNPRDAGKYRCLAGNFLGMTYSPNAELNVLGGNLTIKEFNRTDPYIELLFVPENSTAYIGESIVLTCEATGFPEPRLQWFHDGVELSLENADGSTLVEYIVEGGDLTLLDVTVDYAGRYECVFDNGYLNISAAALLEVSSVPTRTPSNPPQTTSVTTKAPPTPPKPTQGNNIFEESPLIPVTARQLATQTTEEPEGNHLPTKDSCSGKASILPRRYDITDTGKDSYFRGWVDVRGQGAANDFCRVIEPEEGRMQLACALAGTEGESEYNYVSMLGFDAGMSNTWYMKDEDGDGKDDYCRCSEVEESKYVWCMRAGDAGFDGHIEGGYMGQFTFKAPGDRKEMRKCRKRRVDPFFGLPVIPPS